MLVVPEAAREVIRQDWELEGRDADHVDHVTDDLNAFLRGLSILRGWWRSSYEYDWPGMRWRSRHPRHMPRLVPGIQVGANTDVISRRPR